MQIGITIELFVLKIDTPFKNNWGWPPYYGLEILSINHRSLLKVDNWGNLDLLWFHVREG